MDREWVRKFLEEEAAKHEATGDMRFLGEVSRREAAPQQERTPYWEPRARSSGWRDPGASAAEVNRLLTTDEGLEDIERTLGSWLGPLEGPSRALGGLISGKNPLDTLNNPLLMDALVEKGVPPWLAMTADILLVPDPTGARKATQLIPILGLAGLSHGGFLRMREAIKHAFGPGGSLPPGTPRRAYFASEVLKTIDGALDDAVRPADVEQLRAMRRQVQGLVDWDAPLAGVPFDSTNPLDVSAVVEALRTVGDIELSPEYAPRLNRLLVKWADDMSLVADDLARTHGDWVLRDALNPGLPPHRHNPALEVFDARAALGEGHQFHPRSVTSDLYSEFGRVGQPDIGKPSASQMARNVGLDPTDFERGLWPEHGRLADTGSLLDARHASLGDPPVRANVAELVRDPPALKSIHDMIDFLGAADYDSLIDMVRVFGADEVGAKLSRAIAAKYDPMWDTDLAIHALRMLGR